MAQIANIVINDGKASPLAHTFSPSNIVGGTLAILHERLASGLAIGYPHISVSVKTAEGFDGVNRVSVALRVPQMEVLSGNSNGYVQAPKVAYSDTVKVEFLLPGRSTAANRKDLRVMLTNLLANAIVVDSIENLAPPY